MIESDEGSTPSPVEKRSADGDMEGLLLLAPSEVQEQLGRELEQLERERTQQSRAAASVSNQMYKEAQVCVLSSSQALPTQLCMLRIRKDASTSWVNLEMKPV